ncbi:MAG: acyl-CoA synthetase FdrA [Rhodospirillaceae bacterium]|nr:acyl-CoA synthetase FdrA [Rhodospirillaceae bacterium]MDD9913741.1 acyl-CoA synthetase FdrA [Rhodospirillaceae bacterium]MDD9924771.1 acyl-CoA synthetase FdrA [Rhodospirillaceae bacterium]
MASETLNAVRRGFYLDSVALMRVARAVSERPGIEEAALMMGTPANRDLMRDAGILSEEGEGAEPNDLVIAVRAADRSAAEAALAEAASHLDRPKVSGDATEWRPKTLRQAVKMAPDANLALISVPGDYAIAEARKAIGRGLHAMIFSDNVPVAAERALKEEARGKGLLVMGPDCGTAILGGVPLAFANAVPRGDIGIIGASGTGIQEVSCLIAQNGGGISHAIGVGGRDLSAAVGGITTLMAMDQLDADPATTSIVLISKPPAPAVAEQVVARIAESPKPYTVCFIGGGGQDLPGNATAAATLKDTAMLALGVTKETPADIAATSIGGRSVLGLFSGGTLCAEAQIVFRDGGEAVVSNAPVPNAGSDGAVGHRFLDLGSDEYTQGRPHPMIDPGVRDAPLAAALRDPAVGAVLLDIVIGYGAHADPAGHLATQLASQDRNETTVIASVTGTDSDPQKRSAQETVLRSAGVTVLPSNADAATYALACLRAAS